MSGLDGLIACEGRWTGTNTLQDPHTGGPDETPSTAVVTPVLGGRFVRMDYTWAYGGKAQEGSLLVGLQKKAGTATAHWIDSFHNGEKVMACTGSVSDDGTILVRGSYAVPGHPDWGWRIDVHPGADTLRIIHHNVWPEGKEELAVEQQYTRA